MPTVTANGKTFHFPVGTTQAEMAEAIDTFFSGESGEDMPSSQRLPEGFNAAALQKTVAYPPKTGMSAFIQGAQRGAERIGEGILQRGAELAAFLGQDTASFRERLALTGDIQAQKFKGTQAQSPVLSTAGEITGTIAGFPLAPVSVPRAIGAGAAFGAVQPTKQPGEVAKNVLVEGALGGLASFAAPFIQRGFNLSQSLFAGLYKKATGADPRPEMFTADGNLSGAGREALVQLGIDEQEFAHLYTNLAPELEPLAAARFARASEHGIPLSQAQATQDFAAQEAEQTLKASVSREGVKARAFEDTQQEAIQKAQERFETGFAPLADKEGRGAGVQRALREMQDQGWEAVHALYEKAAKTEGTHAPLDTDTLLDVIDEQLELPVSDDVLRSLERLMAKFGLVEGAVQPAGRFNQVMASDGTTLKFRGAQTPLVLDNAEAFRQGLNRIRASDQTGAVTRIINGLDGVVRQAVETLPKGSPKQQAFELARRAAREQKEIFESKDVIDKLVAYKDRAGRTNLINPDRVIDSVLKGVDATQNLKRIRHVLKNNPTHKTVDAWRGIQAQAAADIFAQSIDSVSGSVSGQRLKTAIKRFGGGNYKEGQKRLKLVFEDRYREFNALVQAIGDATVPVKGVTNPSGTAYKLFNLMVRFGSVGSFSAETLAGLAGRARDAASARRVLRGMEQASPDKVKQAVKANDDLVDAYIRLGLTGTVRVQDNDSP